MGLHDQNTTPEEAAFVLARHVWEERGLGDEDEEDDVLMMEV